VIKTVQGSSELALMAEHLPYEGALGLRSWPPSSRFNISSLCLPFPWRGRRLSCQRHSMVSLSTRNASRTQFMDEQHQGVEICAIHANSESQMSAWLALRAHCSTSPFMPTARLDKSRPLWFRGR